MSLFGLRTARVAPRAKLAVPASDSAIHFSDASRTRILRIGEHVALSTLINFITSRLDHLEQ